MANGTGQSKAPYIIICDGRINLRAARDPLGRIQAASNCATALVSYYGDLLDAADTAPISDLQHEMMDVVEGTKTPGTHSTEFRSADDLVDEMFARLEALEEKMRL